MTPIAWDELAPAERRRKMVTELARIIRYASPHTVRYAHPYYVEQARRSDLPAHLRERLALRILDSVVEPETGCWLWLGGRTYGYGRIKINGHLDGAHRVSYRLFVGPIPGGHVIDHQCHNRSCVNPDHLEAVTQSVNMRRAHLISAAIKERQS